MKTERTIKLLNTACEIITELHNADKEMTKRINVLFNEIKYADKIDDETCSTCDHHEAINRRYTR
jgi:hypothetical protein